MIPAFHKNPIPNICALIGCIVCSRGSNKSALPKLPLLLAAVFILSPLVTSALNNDTILVGENNSIPGVDYYDAGSAIVAQILFFLPFWLGWRYLRAPTDIQTLM